MRLAPIFCKLGLMSFSTVVFMFSVVLAGDTNSIWDKFINPDGTLNFSELEAAASTGVIDPAWFSARWDLETGERLSAPTSAFSTVTEDANWSGGFAVPGVDERIEAVYELGGSLYIAGTFKYAGGILANRIARWDGTEFWPLDGGLNNSRIEKLGEYQTKLVAAGRYLSEIGGISVNSIAVWNGLSWSALGSGLDGYFFDTDIFEYQGLLLVSGRFSPLGNDSVSYLAAWDGVGWSSFDGELNGTVRSMTIYQGELIIGGGFTMAGNDTLNHLARWDGSNWRPFGEGMDGVVRSLLVFEDRLIVGGMFSNADGVEAVRVANWDGATWTAMSGGIDKNHPVVGLELVNGELYGKGGFMNLPDIRTYFVAKWNGSEWRALNTSLPAIRHSDAYIASFGGKLTMVGISNALEGLFVEWDGVTFNPLRATGDSLLGLNAWSLTSTIHENQIVTAGYFMNAGSEPANHIVIGDGSSWTALGDGLSGIVRNVGHFGPYLVAAGQFDFGPIENRSNGAVALWRDGVWQAIGEELLGTGSNGATSIVEHKGKLVAGGLLSFEGSIGANVAAWDGNNWESVGLGVDGIVLALTSYDGDLIAGGGFARAGMKLINFLAAWDGVEWKPLGDEVPGPVYDLAVMGSELVVGGETESGEGYVRVWNGVSWTELGAGTLTGRVEAVAVLGCQIYAGGYFGNNMFHGLEPVELQFIARWDGARWVPLGSGFNAPVFTIQPFNGDLFVGGCFSSLAKTNKPTAGITIWTPPAGTSCCETAGDANRSGSVNIADVTFMIGRIFSGGPAPCCIDEADANGDNRTNIGDITYLISRIFAGGAAPICGTSGV